MCMWLVDPRLGAEWKPNRSKMVICPGDNSLDIECDAGYPLAWKSEPYFHQIQEWALAARQHDGFVWVCVGNKTTLIAPEGEFPLGELHGDDRIITKFTGSRFTGVRVVKASELGNVSENPEL